MNVPLFVLPPRRLQFNGCVEHTNVTPREEFWNLYEEAGQKRRWPSISTSTTTSVPTEPFLISIVGIWRGVLRNPQRAGGGTVAIAAMEFGRTCAAVRKRAQRIAACSFPIGEPAKDRDW